MKFFRKSKDSDYQKNSVLFVCVENAGRSQMAEGFFRKYSPVSLVMMFLSNSFANLITKNVLMD